MLPSGRAFLSLHFVLPIRCFCRTWFLPCLPRTQNGTCNCTMGSYRCSRASGISFWSLWTIGTLGAGAVAPISDAAKLMAMAYQLKWRRSRSLIDENLGEYVVQTTELVEHNRNFIQYLLVVLSLYPFVVGIDSRLAFVFHIHERLVYCLVEGLHSNRVR